MDRNNLTRPSRDPFGGLGRTQGIGAQLDQGPGGDMAAGQAMQQAQCEAEEDISPIAKGARRLLASRERLSQILSVLEERLEPVLRPAPTAPVVNELQKDRNAPETIKSNMAEGLLNNARFLDNLGERIAFLLQRLEV